MNTRHRPRFPTAGEVPGVVDLASSRSALIEDFLAVARAGASGAGGLFTAVGSHVDPDLALDWWLRATRLPRLGWTDGGHVAAFAVAAPPEATLPPWARLRWLTAATRRGATGPARRILRQLAASERNHPSAPHFCVPVLAAPSAAGATGAARRLLEAVQERSATHPTSTGVCCETGDATVSALLEDLGHRPAARFHAGGVRRTVFFCPDAGNADLDEPLVVPIEDSIDLHRFRPAEVGEVVASYVEAAFEAGLREVRIIHGRGRGVQRHRVQRLLARDPRVERFSDAPADRGGRGATIAWLSERDPESSR